MSLIGITGDIGVGKTTIAEYLCKEHGFEEYTFSEPIKDIARIIGFKKEDIFGTQAEKEKVNPSMNMSGRDFMVKFGTEFCREKINEDIWVNIMKHKL